MKNNAGVRDRGKISFCESRFLSGETKDITESPTLA